MSGLRLLDLCCRAGGASVGYHRAGFTDIVGWDLEPIADYPYELIGSRALQYLEAVAA